jgi:enoyl-CoA hydratase/carnithine racemase
MHNDDTLNQALYQHITYQVQNPVAIITMNLPDALNTFTNRMLAEIRHALAAAEDDLSALRAKPLILIA